MTFPVNVLLFPCGKENALELHDALSVNVNVRVYGASSVRDHGLFVFENYFGGLPFIQDAAFIDAFNQILEKHQIDIVFPTHDTVAVFLAQNAARIKAKLAAPSVETALACRDKKQTYDLIAGEDFAPRLFANLAEVQNSHLPVFIKPRIGEGSRNAKLVKELKELDDVKRNAADWIISEFLPGTELTVDCFTDRKGQVIFTGPRQRNRVVNGISHNATRYPLTDELSSMAENISGRFHMRGLWYFQVKQDVAGKFKLLEVSCRASGTMVFYRMLGVNFALLTVYDLLELDVSVVFNDLELELDRCIRNRFSLGYGYDRVYVDYDDCLIFGPRVNEKVLAFLYQCRNRGKSVHLITHHDGDIRVSLREHAISAALFTEIIHLNPDQPKVDAISPERSIFIDNAFAQRRAVARKLGIPVFDVDAIDVLIR